MTDHFPYIIVGAGLAGASAMSGIREIDPDGAILLIGNETHLPYHRPPLTKKLWLKNKPVDSVFVNPEDAYHAPGITAELHTEIVALDAGARTVTDNRGKSHHYDKLLLATGGKPRQLQIPGGNLQGLYYYRFLDDYLSLRPKAVSGSGALVIGGGFIGSEIAVALRSQDVNVTMLYPEDYLVSRVFPEGLGLALQQLYIDRGISIIHGKPADITHADGGYTTTTADGETISSDIVVIGVGISPNDELARQAGLTLGNGIAVDEKLLTSDPNIFAAGDVAEFPYLDLGMRTRVEHWDHALNHGKQAGRNMAGTDEAYTYMPYFFSDLFEFGYEAVGEVNSRLETFADWTKENDTGVIYYLREGKVRGAMMCNVWDKTEAARELIRRNAVVTPEDLRGAIA